MACYIFYTERERHEVIDEFQKASNEAQMEEPLQKYHYVPQKIVEMQHDSTWQNLIQILSESLKYIEGISPFYSPPSRQTIVRFLEWGDNLRE